MSDIIIPSDADFTVLEYVARAYVQIIVFSHGLSEDYPAMRRLRQECPGVLELRRRLKAHLGPLKFCMNWSA